MLFRDPQIYFSDSVNCVSSMPNSDEGRTKRNITVTELSGNNSSDCPSSSFHQDTFLDTDQLHFHNLDDFFAGGSCFPLADLDTVHARHQTMRLNAYDPESSGKFPKTAEAVLPPVVDKQKDNLQPEPWEELEATKFAEANEVDRRASRFSDAPIANPVGKIDSGSKAPRPGLFHDRGTRWNFPGNSSANLPGYLDSSLAGTAFFPVSTVCEQAGRLQSTTSSMSPSLAKHTDGSVGNKEFHLQGLENRASGSSGVHFPRPYSDSRTELPKRQFEYSSLLRENEKFMAAREGSMVSSNTQHSLQEASGSMLSLDPIGIQKKKKNCQFAISDSVGSRGVELVREAIADASAAAIAATAQQQQQQQSSKRSRDDTDGKEEEKTEASKKSRAAEFHNLSERKRRDKINEKLKQLSSLIPNSTKADKASFLDEVIQYIKILQEQIQIMSLRSGMSSASPLHSQMAPPQHNSTLSSETYSYLHSAPQFGYPVTGMAGMGAWMPPPMPDISQTVPPMYQPFRNDPVLPSYPLQPHMGIPAGSYGAFPGGPGPMAGCPVNEEMWGGPHFAHENGIETYRSFLAQEQDRGRRNQR